MQVQTRGEFGGLGIEVTQENGLIKVVTPIDDTPAARAGILSGDIIAAIDGENVHGMTLNQAVDKMRGEPNTVVTLKILRGAKQGPADVKLTRAVIQIKSVRSIRKATISAISGSPSSTSRPPMASATRCRNSRTISRRTS